MELGHSWLAAHAEGAEEDEDREASPQRQHDDWLAWTGGQSSPLAFVEETETLDFGLLCLTSDMCAPMASNNLFSGNKYILILFSTAKKV